MLTACFAILLYIFSNVAIVFADHGSLRNDTFETLPDSATATFRTNSQRIWDHEHAQREGRFLSPFVYSGGLHPTSSTLTSATFTTEAFTPERINQEAAAITYETSTTNICWTIISSDNDGITNWIRAGETAYYFQCQGEGATTPVRPALPANSTWLMEVFITGGALTTVRYIGVPHPIPLSSLFGAYSIREFGARCDASTDDSNALRLANILLTTGATLFIPEGQCNIASTVTFTKGINIRGMGPDSILFLTMGVSTDGIVYNAGGTTNIYGPELRDFAILGNANSARNCLVMRYVNIARVKNVHVFCGTPSTGYAVWLQDFVLQSHFNFISNGTYIGYPSIGASPGNGIKATTTPGDTPGTFNANFFDLDLTGPGAAGSTGLWIYSGGSGAGNNEVKGTYQGWGGDGIFVRGGTGAHIHDAHLEGGDVSRSNRLHVQDQSDYTIGPNVLVTSGTPDENCLIQTSSNGIINGLSCDVFRLESSPNTRISHIRTNSETGSHIEDASIHTAWLTPGIGTGAVRIESGSFMDGSSIAVNGSAERWTTTTSAPPNIAAGVGGAATWARESTIVFHGNYSMSVNTSAANISGVQILTATQASRLAGRKVAFTARVYVPAGQPDITPTLYLDNGAETGGYNIIGTKNAWSQVSGSIAIAADGTMGVGGRTDAKLLFLSAGTNTNYYIDAVSVVPSHAGAPIYYTQNAEEYMRYAASVTINPGVIAANTTVGTSVTVLGAATGDVCTIGPPAAIAAGLGWSCVVTAADTVNVRIHNVSAGGITPASASWAIILMRIPS